MPAVFVDLLLEGQRKVELKGLLNSGATDLEIVVPRRVWRELGVHGKRGASWLLEEGGSSRVCVRLKQG